MKNILNIIKEKYGFSNIQMGETIQQKGGRIVSTFVSNEKKYILKIADKSKIKKDIDHDTFIFPFLKEKGFITIPRLIKTKSQKRYLEIDGKFVYVLEYINGENPKNTIENWSVLGELMAQLHHIEDYPYKTSFTFQNEKPTLLKIAKDIAFKKEYLELVDSLPNFDDFPQSLIHSDVGLHNSIKTDSGSIILIDWDGSGMGTRILDLGFPLICQFVTSDLIFEKEKATAFYNSYLKNNSITEKERKILFEASLFFALMYLPYGNIAENWEKIQFAVKNRVLMSQVLN